MQQPVTLADEQLIQFYLNGDNNALSTLVYLNKDKIYSAIYLMVRDKGTAEEIFQEVFTRIIDDLMVGKYTADGKFLQYAMRIAHTLCFTYFRSTSKATVTLKDDDNFSVASFSITTIRKGVNKENHESLRKMIEILPNEQREVIALHQYGDLSFKEIAEMMKCDINVVLGHMRYGLKNLCKIMEEKQAA